MVLLLTGAWGVVTGTCVLKSFRFRSARFSHVALVLKPWPFFAVITTWRKSCGRVLLGILGGSEPPGSFSWPYFKPKELSFSKPFFSPGFQAEIMSYNTQIFLFLSYSLIWNWNYKYVLTRRFFPRKPYPIPNQNEQSVYPFLDRKSAKIISIPMWLTVYSREYSPGKNPSILKILSAGLGAL